MSYDEILEGSEEPEVDLDPALMAVVERRVAEIESGAVKPIPAEEVHRRVRAKLRNSR
jgi:hypothetical protein